MINSTHYLRTVGRNFMKQFRLHDSSLRLLFIDSVRTDESRRLSQRRLWNLN